MISTPSTEDVFVLMDEQNPILFEVMIGEQYKSSINIRANSIKHIGGTIYFFCDNYLVCAVTERILDYFRPVPTSEDRMSAITAFISSSSFLAINDKFEQIKMLRAKFNLPLKEAKEIVETGKVPV